MSSSSRPAKGGRKAQSYDEFRSVSRRRENAQRSAARKRLEERDEAAAEDAAEASGGEDEDEELHAPSFRERIGAFVESPELQFVVTIFIMLDVVVATLQLLIQGGLFAQQRYASILPEVSKFLDYSSVFMTMMFQLELLLLLFAFGLRILGHIGYTADFLVVGGSFYLQIASNTKAGRLMGLLRLWRVGRLLNSVIANVEDAHSLTKEVLMEEKENVDMLLQEQKKLESALKREGDAKARAQDMLRSYKEEVDTLREALHIAATAVAETQGLDSFGPGNTRRGRDVGDLERDELQGLLDSAADEQDGSLRRRRPGGAGGDSNRMVIGADGSVTHA